MKTTIVAAALGLAVAMGATGAQAAGCVSGAVVGGVAGHVAGHHGLLGAAAGCAIGHHMGAKQRQQDAAAAQQSNAANHPTNGQTGNGQSTQ